MGAESLHLFLKAIKQTITKNHPSCRLIVDKQTHDVWHKLSQNLDAGLKPRLKPAPRSGARKLARGTRFSRTPGIRRQLRNLHPEGVSRTPRTLSGCGCSWFSTTGGCARSRSLNPRLIS